MRRAAALLALLAAPAAAQEDVEGRFTWLSTELATLAPDDNRRVVAIESRLAFDGEGPLAGLTGTCLRLVRVDADARAYEAQGHCVLVDAGGDRLAARLDAEEARGPVPAEGRGRWDGGTGRFAGVEGSFRFGLVTYGLGAAGQSEGTGWVRGTWTGAAPAPAPRPLIDPAWPATP